MEKGSIRLAKESDAERLLGIYAPYVAETAITFEYDVPSVSEFQERIHHTLERYPYLVFEKEGRIEGYAYAGPFKTRAAYQWDVETSIYVERGLRRQGIGKALYAALEDLLRKQHVLNVNACIACAPVEDEYLTNSSEAFHEHLGYRMVGKFTRCGYKFGRWYDMVWMEKLVGDHGKNPLPVVPLREALKGVPLG